MFKIIRSRDHIPPHVHIIKDGEWEIQIGFSFICDRVYLYEVKFGSNKLKEKELKELKEEIRKDRVKWRKEWISKNPYAGLNYKNKYLEIDEDGNFLIKSKNTKLLKIKEEKFENGEVVFILSDKSEVRIKPDTGSKEDF